MRMPLLILNLSFHLGSRNSKEFTHVPTLIWGHIKSFQEKSYNILILKPMKAMCLMWLKLQLVWTGCFWLCLVMPIQKKNWKMAAKE